MKLTKAVIKRVKEINNDTGLSARKFAMSLGNTPSAINEIYSGRIKVLSDPIVTILELRYGINPHWLETGKGSKHASGQYVKAGDELEILNLYRALPLNFKRMAKTVLSGLNKEAFQKKK